MLLTVKSSLTSVTCLCPSEYMTIMYSEGHKYVTDVKLDLTVVLLDRTLLFRGLN